MNPLLFTLALGHKGEATAPARSRWSIFGRRFARNRVALAGAVVLAALFTVAILAPVIVPQDRDRLQLTQRLKQPGSINPEINQPYYLGTDSYGRDLLTRLIYGSRISLSIGFVAMVISLSLGVLVGSVAGFYGGWIDHWLMRLVDILLCVPTLPLLLTVLAFVGNSIWLIICVIGVTSWMGAARLVRGEILSLNQRDFIEAVHSLGASDFRILAKHILPNLMHVLIVSATLRVANGMLVESGLSYLGIGVQPPTPSWGNMLYENQAYLRMAWWTNLYPGLCIFVAMMAFYAVGEGLRDALDPRTTN